MLYITGDTHIPTDVSKLNSKRFPEQKSMTKDDFVIIAGDFGGIWDSSNEERYWLKWLEEKSFTTLFVDGNHENFTELAKYEVVPFHGGQAHRISDSVYHLMRGQVYSIDGKRIFTLGGASSHDREYRTEGVSWWSEELPNKGELDLAEKNLDSVDRKVDVIITHCAPSSIQKELGAHYAPDRLTEYLEILSHTVSYENWYFGHYHTDLLMGKGFVAVFDKIHTL